jgi:transcription-repair coupling factor (superfamily II helicase)
MEDMHLLSFYKSAESATKEDVHELGSKRWKGVRAKACKKIQDTAAELLQMSAVRESKKGLTCDMKAEEYKEFANNFQFKETEDQEQAIEEVISDMQSGKPMERLLCGDVGLGKTELAMRAAFLAVTNGFQVAVLTPTTLLCEQHYERFLERFNDVECASIGMLSRFYTKKQNDQNYEDLENNKINIIVGTHSLIQNKIKFKNIGLVIIDEEHRFGVKQKESFKKKYPNIHILSMTATPIPRSLNIAMNSVRDMSIMATPPKARLAINTSVIEDIGEKLTSAISREVERGGQVFYLHNDVSTIEHEKIRLEKLLPDCQIGVAHGQMSNIELEDAMIQMYHRKIQVLVCSTIVETGIDIPNVNTIIIQGAHNFGLSQLHQLRGRVGRSHLQAYCYLVTHKKLNKTSQRRIDTIVKYNKLGDGFNIAMQDLEIRGVGDLLGKEQSGNVKSVGFDLYISMLKKAIQLYKDGVLDQEDDIYASRIKSDIHFSLAIPRAYIDEVQDRLLVYKRITNCNSVDEISTIKQELIDKYGAFSLEVDLLFRFHILQIHAKNLDITAIRMNSVSGSIRFKPSDKIIEKMIEILQATGNDKIFSLHPDAKMSFKGDFDDEEKSIFFLEGLINKLL